MFRVHDKYWYSTYTEKFICHVCQIKTDTEQEVCDHLLKAHRVRANPTGEVARIVAEGKNEQTV